MDIRERFGRNVRVCRQNLGLSQEALAEQSGLHRTYISGLESGRRNPTITVVAQLAKALRVKASDLLEDIDES